MVRNGITSNSPERRVVRLPVFITEECKAVSKNNFPILYAYFSLKSSILKNIYRKIFLLAS